MDCLSRFPFRVQECTDDPNREPRNEDFLWNVTMHAPINTLLLRSRPACFLPLYSSQLATAITRYLTGCGGDAALINPYNAISNVVGFNMVADFWQFRTSAHLCCSRQLHGPEFLQHVQFLHCELDDVELVTKTF